jgi:hypothetical protein
MRIRLTATLIAFATLLTAASATADVTPQRTFVVTQAQFN